MKHQTTGAVLSCEEVAQGMFLLWAKVPDIPREGTAGQFVMVACHEPGLLLRRPMSICNYGDGTLSILFNRVGAGTTWLSRRSPGDPIEMIGPLGHGFQLEPPVKRLLIV